MFQLVKVNILMNLAQMVRVAKIIIIKLGPRDLALNINTSQVHKVHKEEVAETEVPIELFCIDGKITP